MKAPFWLFQASVSIQLCVNEGEYSRLVAKMISDASGILPVLWTDHGTRKLARAIVGIEVVVIPREDQDAVFWDVAALVWSGTAARIAIDNAQLTGQFSSMVATESVERTIILFSFEIGLTQAV